MSIVCTVGTALWLAGTLGADKEIELQDVNLEQLAGHVAKHKGKPVLIDIWATWCIPCREKFPKFVKLAEKYKDKAEFASLSLDESEMIAAAKEFLAKNKAHFTNLRMTEDAEKVEKKYGFEGVPRYLVFDKQGKLVEKLGDVTKVEEKLAEMLGEKHE